MDIVKKGALRQCIYVHLFQTYRNTGCCYGEIRFRMMWFTNVLIDSLREVQKISAEVCSVHEGKTVSVLVESVNDHDRHTGYRTNE